MLRWTLGRQVVRAGRQANVFAPRCQAGFATSVENPPPRYSGIATFFRAPHVDMHEDPAGLSKVDVGVVGVPFDGGVTSRPGARHGPREVRTQSATNVRRVNQATGCQPFDIGMAVADVGDAYVSRPFELIGAHSEIQAHFATLLDAGVLPVAIGGDHSVSLPILRAHGAKRAEQGLPPLAMIHIDAHADTGDDYMGSKFHHGAPFKIAVDEGLIDPKRVVQFGIRGTTGFPDQWKFSYESGMRVIDMDECESLGPKGILEEIKRVVGDRDVYITFDIDALDPAYAPGTGTPEIGGLTPIFTQTVLRGLGNGGLALNIVGADLVEVSPPLDAGNLAALAGANLAFELLCIAVQAKVRASKVA